MADNNKELTPGEVFGPVGTAAANYIQEIYDGTNTHVVAVKNGIRFFNGQSDTDGMLWDGIQPFEVVIPTLGDIIANPVTLKGVVDADHQIPVSASDGDLWYIGIDGVTVGGQLCEAGDMAVWYNNAWHVISGENQVTINTSGASQSGNDYVHTITGTAKTLLTVEGKTLSIALDYDDIASHVSVTKNNSATFNVANGTVTVGGMSIALTKTAGETQDITTPVSISLPSSLNNGTVTINENVLASTDFTFTQGSFPTISKNAAAISVDASTDIAVTGTFLTGATQAIGSVTIQGGSNASHDLAFATGISASTGTSFVTGIRTFDSTKDQVSDVVFEIPGAVTVTGVSTFATGFGQAGDSGDVVSSITVGTVTIGTGTDVVTGLSGGGNTVVASVAFGDATKDTAREWFYSGLTEGSDVVTDVTVGAVSLVSGNNTAGMTASALVTASVSNHVLSFTTGSFMKPVDISQAASSVSKKGFTKSGVSLSGFDSTPDTFTKGGISQAETSVSYKSLTTDSIAISLGSATQYVAPKAEDHAYTAVMGYAKLSVTDAVFTSGSPTLTNTGITATIPADTVAVDITGGSLPTLSISAPSGSLTGSVSTALSTSEVSWLAVDSTKKNIKIADTYALTSDSSATGIVGSAITVAKASTYGVSDATVTIASNTYVTGVTVLTSISE